jgi:hypothetical protein
VTDFPQQGVDLQILNVTKEQVGEMLEDRLAVHLSAGFKPFLANRTNLRILASLLGPDTGNWIGKVVNVYVDPTVQYAGRLVGGIRVRAAMHQLPTPQPQQPQATEAQYRQASGAQIPPSFYDLKDDFPF